MANISYFTTPDSKAYFWLASYSGEIGGAILLSRPLKSEDDIDRCVDRLIAQLERARIQAKRDLGHERLTRRDKGRRVKA